MSLVEAKAAARLKCQRERLINVIRGAAAVLMSDISWADPLLLLAALAEVETDFGRYNVPKYEAAFDLGGRFGNRNLWSMHGAMAACSWSSFQIMHPVCVELGFDPHRSPYELADDEVAIHFVLAYVQRRMLAKGVRTLQAWADAWNSGSWTDSFVPGDYIQRFLTAYDCVQEKYGLFAVNQ